MLTELFIFVVILTIGWLVLFRKTPKNFPPGPWGFPLVGHLPLLGQSPHKTLLEWKRTYGPIIGVQFGSYRTVVINDAKLIKEALCINAFSGRPRLKPLDARSGGVAKGIIFTEGHIWFDQRRFTLKNLRDFGIGQNSMETKIQNEIIELMDTFKATVGKPIQMRNAFNPAVINALWSILFGERMKQDDPELLDAIRRLTASIDESNFIASVATFIPWLADIAPKLSGFEKMMKEVDPLVEFIRTKIDRHNCTHVDGEPRDYLDSYLDEVQKTTDPDSPFNKNQDHMIFTIMDLFIAGGETTSTTLTWLFAYMVTYPQVQEKMYQEIKDAVGNERLPSLSDRSSMKYTEAVLNEVLRCSSLLPLSLFHSTTEDVQFHGYNIPKDTMIMPNLYSAHFDESVWGDPQNFRPERFLEENGNIKKFDSLIPFSTGKRVCLGESLARNELFLFSTHLFQMFKATYYKALPNLDPSVGIVLLPRPFEVILTKR